MWETSGQVPRRRRMQALDDVRVVGTEPVAGEQHAGAQALRMQPPAELGAKALPDSMGRERDPGHDQHHRNSGERRQPAPGRCPPEPEQGQRNEDHRVQLHRERRTEQSKRKRPAPIEESRERTDRQQRGQRVVGVQRDGAERDRYQGEKRGRGRELGDACAAPGKQEDHQVDRPDRAERHQHLEERVVPVARRKRRSSEERDRPGRILDEHVPVGQAAVEQRVTVFAVQVEVPELRAPEEPAARNRERAQQQRSPQRRHAQRNPGRRAHREAY